MDHSRFSDPSMTKTSADCRRSCGASSSRAACARRTTRATSRRRPFSGSSSGISRGELLDSHEAFALGVAKNVFFEYCRRVAKANAHDGLSGAVDLAGPRGSPDGRPRLEPGVALPQGALAPAGADAQPPREAVRRGGAVARRSRARKASRRTPSTCASIARSASSRSAWTTRRPSATPRGRRREAEGLVERVRPGLAGDPRLPPPPHGGHGRARASRRPTSATTVSWTASRARRISSSPTTSSAACPTRSAASSRSRFSTRPTTATGSRRRAGSSSGSPRSASSARRPPPHPAPSRTRRARPPRTRACFPAGRASRSPSGSSFS